MKALLLLLGTVSLLCAEDKPALDDCTMKKLAQALDCVNLSIEDLNWDKRPISDDFRLPLVNEALDRPLSLTNRALEAEAQFNDDPLASAQAAGRWLDVKPPLVAPPKVSLPKLDGVSDEAHEAIERVVAAWMSAEALRKDSLRALSPAELELLKKRGRDLYLSESEEEWDMTAVLAAAKKVDLADLVAAECALAEGAAYARAHLAAEAGKAWKARRIEYEGITIGIGGPEDDTHDEAIVFDTGGDDIFKGCAVVVSLAGDGTYRNCAKGYFACGLIVNLAGNDRYEGDDFVEGGAAFGASLLVDVAGEDHYDASQCSQGAAFFGVGMLFDLGGNDSYRGERFVQGFGGCRGLGALSSVSGNDLYYAGGRFSHAPLLPENYQSLSQGFGFGLRPVASGGVGILCDHGGNDVFDAEVFGQGCSYWFSLGILVTSAGHDKFSLYQYGQGAGIHLSAAILFKRKGNDAFQCNLGVAQGCGHDWGVGILWDLGGDDYYSGSGLTQGGANANGIGMLIDQAGADCYAGNHAEIQGFSFQSRDTIGLGLLLDLDGHDRFTQGGKDGAVWTRSSLGVGLDCEEEKK